MGGLGTLPAGSNYSLTVRGCISLRLPMTESNPPPWPLPAPEGPEPEIKPARVTLRIKAAPAIRQLYWCDFPTDAQLPEMWKTRPVLVVSYKNTLHGPCTVVPCSTDPQEGNSWALPLTLSLDGRKTWVVCNHLYTFAPSRFSTGPGGKVLRVPETEFNSILELVLKWLPVPRGAQPPAGGNGT